MTRRVAIRNRGLKEEYFESSGTGFGTGFRCVALPLNRAVPAGDEGGHRSRQRDRYKSNKDFHRHDDVLVYATPLGHGQAQHHGRSDRGSPV